MKKEVTLGQIIAVAVTVIIAMAGGWITIQKKVAVAEQKIMALEMRQAEDKIEYRKAVDELKWQIADGNQKITDILIQLQNKANRR